jgi:hypothetical protein
MAIKIGDDVLIKVLPDTGEVMGKEPVDPDYSVERDLNNTIDTYDEVLLIKLPARYRREDAGFARIVEATVVNGKRTMHTEYYHGGIGRSTGGRIR